MLKAYVMVTVDRKFSNKTAKKLVKIGGVRTVDILYGVYDGCIVVEARSMRELEKMIVSKIRKVDGVGNTLTLIVARSIPV